MVAQLVSVCQMLSFSDLGAIRNYYRRRDGVNYIIICNWCIYLYFRLHCNWCIFDEDADHELLEE